MQRNTPATLAVVCALALAAFLLPSVARADAATEFPDAWAQGGPYSLDALRGKVVVLVFYEESCPTCRKSWPGRLAEADKYKDKPVLFVAVNSGNHPAKVSSYLQGVQCDWPAIADTDRSYEKASGVGVISLNNIYQTRVITPTGDLLYAGELSESVERYLSAAKWKIDPATVPEAYKEVWRFYEFGNLKMAGLGLKKVRAKTDQDRAFVEKLTAALSADADARMAKAKAAQDAGDTWAASKLYDSVVNDFANTDQATEARKQWRELEKDDKVKTEKAAARMLMQVKALAASYRPEEQANAKVGAAMLIKKYPDTEAARIAENYK